MKRLFKSEKVNGEWIKKPTENLILTFEGESLPSHVILFTSAGWKVHPYVQQVKICFNCYNFGHSRAQCRLKQVCINCGDTSHLQWDKESSTPKPKCPKPQICINCGLNHLPTSKLCPKMVKNKILMEKCAQFNLSPYEAKKIYKMFKDCARKFSPISDSPIKPFSGLMRFKENFPILTKQPNGNDIVDPSLFEEDTPILNYSTAAQRVTAPAKSAPKPKINPIRSSDISSSLDKAFPNGLTATKGQEITKVFGNQMSKFVTKSAVGRFTIKNLNVKNDLERLFIPFFKSLSEHYPKGIDNNLAKEYLEVLRLYIVNAVLSASNSNINTPNSTNSIIEQHNYEDVC